MCICQYIWVKCYSTNIFIYLQMIIFRFWRVGKHVDFLTFSSFDRRAEAVDGLWLAFAA